MPANDLLLAGAIAIGLTMVLSFIEILSTAKTPWHCCLVMQSFFYFVILAAGNVVATILSFLAAVKIPSLSPSLYPYVCPIFAVFGFEGILKNTNITMFDQGVLTIQTWLDKALNIAAAAAIEEKERQNQEQAVLLESALMKLTEGDINTRILNKIGPDTVRKLEDAATENFANKKQYKVMQLVSVLTPNEARSIIKMAKSAAPPADLPEPTDERLTNNDVSVLLAMEDGANRLPGDIQQRADEHFKYKFRHDASQPMIENRLRQLVSKRLADKIGDSEFRITSYGKHVLRGLRQNPGGYHELFAPSAETEIPPKLPAGEPRPGAAIDQRES